MSDLPYAFAFPLVRAGGLFLAIVGAGIIIGAVMPRFRGAALGVAAFIAAVLTTLLARQLSAPFGAPTAIQVWSLVGAVALEMALIPLVVRKVYSKGPRTVMLAVMLVVGIHFVPMALAFGPAMLGLALLACLIAAGGLLKAELPASFLWGLDGAAKLAVGGFMWLIG